MENVDHGRPTYIELPAEGKIRFAFANILERSQRYSSFRMAASQFGDGHLRSEEQRENGHITVDER